MDGLERQVRGSRIDQVQPAPTWAGWDETLQTAIRPSACTHHLAFQMKRGKTAPPCLPPPR